MILPNYLRLIAFLNQKSSSESDQNQWVEKVIEPSSSIEQPSQSSFQKPLEREEWMSLPGIFPSISDESRKEKGSKAKKKEEKYLLDNLGQTERELNPHWKNGGTGLPEIQDASKHSNQIMDVNWLKKSFQRAKEKAEEEGIPLEQIAAERWGVNINIYYFNVQISTYKSFHNDFHNSNNEFYFSL